MKILIYPGSFDPIHMGHLEIALHVVEKENADKLIFVPSGVSPNKRFRQKTPGKIRFDWIQKALDAEKNFGKNPEIAKKLEVSDIESRHNVTTYTLETIEAIAKQNPGASLLLLCGEDTKIRMQRWPSYPKLQKICQFVVIPRDNPQDKTSPQWPHSSTEVKATIAKGGCIQHLVPKVIAQEIALHFGKKPPQIGSLG
jgi:nicotinate-nucleotide adenylyltransferase